MGDRGARSTCRAQLMGGAVGWWALAVVLLAPRPAAADEPPPPDYVERCTKENAESGGDECVATKAWRGCRDCDRLLSEYGFCERCSSRKEKTVYYCRAKGSDKPLPADWEAQGVTLARVIASVTPPPLEPKQCPTDVTKAKQPVVGCSCDVGGAGGAGVGGAPLLLLVTCWARRVWRTRRVAARWLARAPRLAPSQKGSRRSGRRRRDSNPW